MSETITTVNLNELSFIAGRDISVDKSISSIDINQTDGSFSVVYPYDQDGQGEGSVVIYPQSLQSRDDDTVEFKTFNIYGGLYSPLDARFDYIRRKLWILDTGNHRILRVDLKEKDVDFSIDDTIYYPHALAINFNNGGIFVKGYTNLNRNTSVIYYFRNNGEEIDSFVFDSIYLDSSSSSSESSISVTQSLSESESSSIAVMPSCRSIAYDTSRSNLWWTSNDKVYVANIRNKQVQSNDISQYGYINGIGVDVEISSGNAFVLVEGTHKDYFVIQMSRINTYLGFSYLEY